MSTGWGCKDINNKSRVEEAVKKKYALLDVDAGRFRAEPERNEVKKA